MNGGNKKGTSPLFDLIQISVYFSSADATFFNILNCQNWPQQTNMNSVHSGPFGRFADRILTGRQVRYGLREEQLNG